MAAIVRIGYWNGASPTFTGASDSGVTAEAGTLKFNREDTLSGTTGTVPIPTATGTNFSWLKNLGIEVTTTAPTTISNRRVSVAAAASDVQTLNLSGATSGTFKLTFNGQTTAAIAFNATAAAIKTAFELLTTVGSGNTGAASGGPINTTNVVITFAGTLANMPQNAITVDNSLLVGGTVTVTHTTTGVQILGSGLELHFKGVASGSYAQAASGNQPAASGSNDATPAGYTKITTSAQVWDAAGASANTQGLNGQLLVKVFGVDFAYASPPGQALNAVNLPTLNVLYDEA